MGLNPSHSIHLFLFCTWFEVFLYFIFCIFHNTWAFILLFKLCWFHFTWAPILLRLCHPDKLSFKTRVPDKFLIPGIFRTHSSGTSHSCSSLQRKQNHYHQLEAPYQSWVSGHCYTTCSTPNIFDSCNRRRSWRSGGEIEGESLHLWKVVTLQCINRSFGLWHLME